MMMMKNRTTVDVTVVPTTSADVQLVSGHTEEFCETSLYCGFNVSDVVGVQLQFNTTSGDWLTVYHYNATANNQSWTAQLPVSYSYAVSYRIANTHTTHH